MIILGLNFGHDGAVAVLRDGGIACCLYQERFTRVKHAGGIREHELLRAIEEAGVTIDDIDHCAITSTQGIELLVGLCGGLVDIRFEPHPAHRIPSPVADLLGNTSSLRLESLLSFGLKQIVNSSDEGYVSQAFKAHFPDWRAYRDGKIGAVGWLDRYLWLNEWQPPSGLSQLASRRLDPAHRETLRMGFHYPVTVYLAGRPVPGFFVDHHMAHAASAYYVSGFERAAVMTHDGFSPGTDQRAGMFYYGVDNRLYPIRPHHLTVGALYDTVAATLNLGVIGGAGKLMGLAPYGSPRFFRREFAGNWFDIQQRFQAPLESFWMRHCLEEARRKGYDLGGFARRETMTAPINADIAASTQKVFEESYLDATHALSALLDVSGLSTGNLCLSGGCALNCPANSLVYRDGPFANVFVVPYCADDGLAIGAALHLYHNLLGSPLEEAKQHENRSPYLGVRVTEADIEAAVARYAGRLEAGLALNPAAEAAEALAADQVVAWFEGRSEVGPRALGHRSILANPAPAANWRRVNRIKGREPWRPFAPAVLESEASRWFHGCPAIAEYMLFTARVKSDRVPAITHVDWSSRIQTVNEGTGGLLEVLHRFYSLTGIPMVLNTSFNGPGEPIVESAEDAIASFLKSGADLLILGRRALRPARAASASEEPQRELVASS